MHRSPSILFFFAAALLSALAHTTFFGWLSRSFPAVANHRRRFFFALPFVAIVPSLTRALVLRWPGAVASTLTAFGLLELMFVVACMGPIAFVRGIGRVKFGALPVLPATPPAPAAASRPSAKEAPPDLGRRRAFEAIGGAAMVGATGVALGWGTTAGRHDYVVREIPVKIPGLPKELDGYVIAQMSDIHSGTFVGEREFRQAAEILRKIRPDLLAVTGDTVDMDARHAPPIARALADNAPRDGVVAILGNHDYYSGAAAVSQAMRDAGILLLVNDARILRPGDGGGFALIGLDDAWARDYGGHGQDWKRATASLPSELPRILLAHQPRAFLQAQGKVALQLSGHTHGGQIEPGNMLMRGFVAGRYEQGGSTLYVNSGFGVAGPPARIGVPPEITKVILVAA
jgi:predicted MPP superfamily phosphohydrolase